MSEHENPEIWPDQHCISITLAGPEDAKRLEVMLNDIIGKINELDERIRYIEGFLVL